MKFLDTLEVDSSIAQISSMDRSNYLRVFEQRFRNNEPEIDILHDDQYWTKSIPHEQSGPCETYDPPMKSDPGYEISMFVTMKDMNTSLDVFVHEKDKFFYSKNRMFGKFTRYLDVNEFIKSRNDHTRIIGRYT